MIKKKKSRYDNDLKREESQKHKINISKDDIKKK